MLGFYEPARLHMDSPIVDTVEEFVAIKKRRLAFNKDRRGSAWLQASYNSAAELQCGIAELIDR